MKPPGFSAPALLTANVPARNSVVKGLGQNHLEAIGGTIKGGEVVLVELANISELRFSQS